MGFLKLENKCKELRRTILQIVHDSKASHIGSMFSCLDVVSYLYYNKMNFSKENYKSPERDYFVLSKGHASLVNYAILEDLRIISKEDLFSYYQNGGKLIGHLDGGVEGVEVSTGSLGHGLAIATGIALGNKLNEKDSKTYCLIGDGECNEGSIWESLMFLSGQNLKNLTVIVDGNKLQGYDLCKDIFNTDKLIGMFKALKTNFYDIDGHNFKEIDKTFKEIDKSENEQGNIIFARTIKGKGVSYMENHLEWHYKSPNKEELKKGLEKLI